MTRSVEIKASLDEDGNEYFPVVHIDGLIGKEDIDTSEMVQSNTDEINGLKARIEELEIKNNSQKTAINELVRGLEEVRGRVKVLEESDTEWF